MFERGDLQLVCDSDLSLDDSAISPVGGGAKRAFDLVFASLALVSLSLVFLTIIAAIRISSKGPAFFVHRRVGYGGKTFPCLKFRTMVTDANEQLNKLLQSDPEAKREFELYQKLKKDPRIIPRIGSFLRKTSLDELPQLINVILGHMSIVGPRPVTEDELLKYNDAASDYLSTRPGITGLWQVSGRNNLSFEERVRIDQSYIQRWSFLKDLGIILRTSEVVLLRRGAY